MPLISQLLDYAIFVMTLAIFGSVIISWLRASRVRVPYDNPLVRAVEGLADLMLRPVRERLPVAGGGFDFSPMVALLILYALRSIVGRL